MVGIITNILSQLNTLFLSFSSQLSNMPSFSLPVMSAYQQTIKESAATQGLTYLEVCPPFQRCFNERKSDWSSKLIDTLIMDEFSLPPIWVIEDKEGSHQVLDGMHRIMTIFKFLNNEIVIDSKHMDYSSFDQPFKGTYGELCTLNPMYGARIRRFKLVFNVLDATYLQPAKLKDIFERLNQASVQLNMFELNKVTYAPLYKMLEMHTPMFLGYEGMSKENWRGKPECDIMTILAFCQMDVKSPGSWSSCQSLKDKWLENYVGKTREQVDRWISENTPDFERRMKLMFKYMDVLGSMQVMKTKPTFGANARSTTWKIAIGRLMRWDSSIPDVKAARMIICKINKELVFKEIKNVHSCAVIRKNVLLPIEKIISQHITAFH